MPEIRLKKTRKTYINFKPGDMVKMKYFDYYATGEITIVTEKTCKVLFDRKYDLAYNYYLKEDLELISPQYSNHTSQE